MTIPATIQEKLEAFLAGGRKPSEGGGWAAVSPDEIDQLHELVESILEAKYEQDADGDLPVQVILTDRTRFQSVLHFDIPHVHKEYENHSPMELRILAADRFSSLARYAAEQANIHLSAMYSELHQTVECQRSMTWRGVKYAAVLPAGTDKESIAKVLDTAIRAKLSKQECPTEYNGKLMWGDCVASEVTAELGVRVLFTGGLSTGKDVQFRFDVPALNNVRIHIDTKKPALVE